jgi:hypothetical protein
MKTKLLTFNLNNLNNLNNNNTKIKLKNLF